MSDKPKTILEALQQVRKSVKLVEQETPVTARRMKIGGKVVEPGKRADVTDPKKQERLGNIGQTALRTNPVTGLGMAASDAAKGDYTSAAIQAAGSVAGPVISSAAKAIKGAASTNPAVSSGGKATYTGPTMLPKPTGTSATPSSTGTVGTTPNMRTVGSSSTVGSGYKPTGGVTSSNINKPSSISTGAKIGAGTAAGAAAVGGAAYLAGKESKEKAEAKPAPQKGGSDISTSSASDERKQPAKATPEKLQSFSQAFAAARQAAKEKGAQSTGQFEYKGKQYQTNIKGEKYVPTSKQTVVGTTKTEPATPPAPQKGGSDASTMPASDERRQLAPTPASSTPSAAANSDGSTPKEKEKRSSTTPKVEEAKMSSSMIEAFLKLQGKNSGDNLFNEAKKLSPKEKELAALGHPKDKITHKDVLIGRGVLAKEDKSSSDPDMAAPRPGGQKYKDEIEYKEKSAPTPPPAGAADAARAKAKMKEEVEFSEAELAHIASVMEISIPSSPVADDYTGSKNGVSKRDLTDETISETKKKDPSELKQRGRKAGVKVGSYKRKDVPDAEGEEHKVEPKNLVAQNPRSYSKDGKNMVDLEHPSKPGVKRTVPAKRYNDFRSSYLNAEKPAEKEKMHDSMVSKVFGNN